MPHFRARVQGISMQDADAAMREAKVGAVTAGDVDNASHASGTPAEDPELQSVTVTVSGSDRDDAERKLADALPEGTSIEILG